MNKLNIIVLILAGVIFTVSTFWVMVKNPYMHKQILITDANYTFVEEETAPPMPVKIQPQNIETQQNIQLQNKVAPKPSPSINKNKQPQQLQQPQKKQREPVVKKQPPTKPVDKKTQKPPVKNNTVNKTPVKKPAVEKTIVKEVKKTAPQKIATQKPVEPVKQETLTEREEVIAWNNWRSQIQNQVMTDTKIGAPMGTQFLFSFTVDKFGNMSNVKVWSQNPVYTDLGVRVVKPVLMGYQNKPILNFPEGTKRVITNVTGGFYIATNTKYSSSKDYSDFEKVKKAD